MVRKHLRVKKKPIQRYQRVDSSMVESLPEELRDNSYYAKKGDTWGEKANDVLKTVSGKDFRSEKTKKKRGSYRGGTIELGVNSFKFS